jgi:hypothetical protein
MKRKLFLFFLVALFAFAVSISFISCKKEKPKDTTSIEDNSDDDISADDEEDAD